MWNEVHLFIWAFIDALKKEDNLIRFKVEQIITGYSTLKKLSIKFQLTN